ncbi:hypothetical protein QE444_001349 [Pseudomonas sp. SORGH_AS199]|uniref:hypothetical protein n=1 Tax=Pseudomonas sp. SORGH_AS_0199 TaxID=3041761 RepID=UPI002858DDD3|nr:hypothetical protein [Pseudomonas sp. SORGH_AS_0199]MDR6228992.1 hypothetical protein [Pseudomonas sp. SORGH_AS_0199]
MNAKQLDLAARRARFEEVAFQQGFTGENDLEHVDGVYVRRPVEVLWQFWQVAAATEPTGQQLYAEIKKSSQYAYQRDFAGWPSPFPVSISSDEFGGYVVQGGPGGQYRLEDVQLFVIEGEKKIRIR